MQQPCAAFAWFPNAFSWICVVPKTGTSRSGETKIAGVNKGRLAPPLWSSPRGESRFSRLAQQARFSYEGNDGVTSVLTYEGSGGGSVLTSNGSGEARAS
jgi:hypothetical protein